MPNKIEKWEEVSRGVALNSYLKVDKVIYHLPNGIAKDFYIKREGPAVGILALTKGQQVILVKQFRPGPNEILNELPGGYVDTNETPEQAAERELLEETGYKGNAKLVATAYDCAYSTMNRYCVVVTDCEKVAEQNLEKNEFAEVVLMPLSEFRELLKSGKNTDIEVGYIGLDYLKLLSSTIESLRLVYDNCCKLYRYFLTWRHQLLAGYLTTLAALGIGFSWTYVPANNARPLAWVVCLLGTFLTVIFWLLDYRNRDLYHACQNVASDIESKLGFNPDTESRKDKGLYAALNQTSTRRITHNLAIDILLGGASIALLAATVYSFCVIR